MDSTSSYVKCNLLKLLTIVSESGGYESVMNALDYQKVSVACCYSITNSAIASMLSSFNLRPSDRVAWCLHKIFPGSL